MNQHEKILLYMKECGSISPMEAFGMGITKLATRISEMRAEGMEFDQKWESHTNLFGEKSHYMRYYLKEDECQKKDITGSD